MAMSAADDRKLESTAVITALRRGTVPNAGLSRLAVGLEAEEKVLSEENEQKLITAIKEFKAQFK